MSTSRLHWYLKAQAGVLLLPVGLCLFGEAVARKVVQMMGEKRRAMVLDRHPQPDLHQRRDRPDDRERPDEGISGSPRDQVPTQLKRRERITTQQQREICWGR